MEEKEKYRWCWDKCQMINEKVCESRIHKGKCKTLPKPKDLTSEVRGALHKEKGEIQIECEESK